MTSPSAAPRAATARERARAELTREIKEEARRQLAATGADGLSLRAVARSSAWCRRRCTATTRAATTC